MSSMIMMPAKRGDRSWRRPSAFFTIGEGSEADDSDHYNEFDSDDEISEKPRRKTSTALIYSSNSSLESDTELGWDLAERRKNRRESVAPMHAGLQTWVDAKGVESVAAGQTAITPGSLGLQLPPVIHQRKKLSYEDLKELLNTGKFKEAKNAVRDSDWDFTDEIRSRLWPNLGSIHEANKTSLDGFYWETVTQLYGSNELPENDSALPGFVDQRLYYQLSSEGKSICDRIVSVVGYAYPEITYCPLLLPVASLFLHFVQEEKTYNCICTLLSARQKVFLSQTKLQWEVTNVTAMQLTKKFSKSAFNFVARQVKPGEKVEQLFHGWIWWIFRDLPLAHVARIMDCFLVEGMKVLYRVAIAILLNFSKASSSDSSWANSQLESSGLESTLSKYCKNMPMTPQRLLKTAFSIRAFRGSEIRKTSTKVELVLKSKATGKDGKIHRSKSSENMPTSQSQHDIQMMSHTLAIKELLMIWQWLPMRITMYQPVMLYTTEEHGCSLTTFFNRVENHEPTILTIKTTNNEVFGAYCSSAWALRNSKDERGERQRYFGTGETFLFSLRPEMVKYPWVGVKPRKDADNENESITGNNKMQHAAELFMHADTHMISIGGGEGQGLVLDEDLRFGKTEHCQTFENPPLVEAKDFEVCVIEVIGFSGM